MAFKLAKSIFKLLSNVLASHLKEPSPFVSELSVTSSDSVITTAKPSAIKSFIKLLFSWLPVHVAVDPLAP